METNRCFAVHGCKVASGDSMHDYESTRLDLIGRASYYRVECLIMSSKTLGGGEGGSG